MQLIKCTIISLSIRVFKQHQVLFHMILIKSDRSASESQLRHMTLLHNTTRLAGSLSTGLRDHRCLKASDSETVWRHKGRPVKGQMNLLWRNPFFQGLCELHKDLESSKWTSTMSGQHLLLFFCLFRESKYIIRFCGCFYVCLFEWEMESLMWGDSDSWSDGRCWTSG